MSESGSGSSGLTARGRRAALPFIFATALMDVIALGIMIPVLPNLVKAFTGGDTAAAAKATLVFSVTWGVMQFVCAPVLGLASDRFGRRPVLLLSIFGLGVDYLFMAFAPSLAWLLVGRILNGATASSFSTANAYVADITAPADRAKVFGLMGAAFSVGFLIGPTLGGVLGGINLRLPFVVSAAMALVNWTYGFFILPESLPPERRSKSLDWRSANPLRAFAFLRERRGLFGLQAVYALFQMAHNAFPSIFVLYVGYRFGWGPLPSGLMLLATGALSMGVQTLLVGRVVSAVGERGALLIGLASASSAFLVYALAPTVPTFLAGVGFGALSALIPPGLQSLMSRRVPSDMQGRLQGVNSAVMGVCAIAGPLIYLPLLAFSVRSAAWLRLPGLPLLLAAGFSLLALAASLALARPAPDADPSPAAA